MRTCIYIGNQNPKNVIERVKWMNEAFQYFPTTEQFGPAREMPDDEIIDCIDNAKKLDWHIIMMAQGKRPDSFEKLDDAQEYYEQLYRTDVMKKAMESPTKSKDKKRKSSSSSVAKKCGICGLMNHTTKDHKTPEQLKNERGWKRQKGKSFNYNKRDHNKDQQKMMANVMAQMFAAGIESNNKKKKRKSSGVMDSFMASLNDKMKQAQIEDEEVSSQSSNDNSGQSEKSDGNGSNSSSEDGHSDNE